MIQPHSDEWFEALNKINPQQAAHTKQIISVAGSADVCGICGDNPARDYEVVGAPLAARWCDDCVKIQGAKVKPLVKD